MRTILSSEVVSKNRLRKYIDAPSDIDRIVEKLNLRENVNKNFLKDYIFMLRNFCAPYSKDTYDRILSLFDVYETLFSMEKFKNDSFLLILFSLSLIYSIFPKKFTFIRLSIFIFNLLESI